MARTKLTDARVKNAKPPHTGTAEWWDSVVPGLALRVSYGGTRSFTVTTRINGRQRRFKVGKYPTVSLSEARRQARDILDNAEQGIDPREAERQQQREAELAANSTFDRVAERYIEEYAKPRKRTWLRDKQQIDKDLLPYWHGVPLANITRADVRKVLKDKHAQHPIQANRLLALVRKLFNWCLENDLIDASPAAQIKPLSPERERDRVLSEAEVRKLWSVFEAMGYPYGRLFQMLLLTGQRRSEVATMRWSEIDRDNAVWTIPGERTKNGKSHQVPLPDLAFAILDAVPLVSEEYVFAGPQNGNPVQSYTKAKDRADARAGVEDWVLHDLRRTCGTYMATLGVRPETVSRVMNHTEGGITRLYNRYSYLAEKREALETWAAELQRIAKIQQDNADLAA
jgi:integrase